MKEDPEFLTTAQVQAITGEHPKTIRRKFKNRVYLAKKVGQWKAPKADLLRKLGAK